MNNSNLGSNLSGSTLLGRVALPGPLSSIVICLELAKACLPLIEAVGKLVLNRPDNENMEVMGMKAEVAAKKGIGPGNFDDIDGYLDYLDKEVEVDSDKIQNMSEFEHYKYQAIGAGLYIWGINQKLGVLVPPVYWATAVKTGLIAMDVVSLIKDLSNSRVANAESFVKYMDNELQPGSEERRDVANAVRSMMEQKYAGIDDDGVDNKIMELKEKYKE